MKGVDEVMLVTLLLPMLEVPRSPGGVVPRERGVRNRGGRGRGGRGGRGGNGGEKGGEKKDGQTTNINTSDGNVDGEKGGDARCSRCGGAGHKTVRCPGQVCSVYDGKCHSAKTCANVVTVFACEADASGSDSDKVLSKEEQDAFVCDAPGTVFDEPVYGVQMRLHGRWEIFR